ncbi:hypothetical protein [Brevundimonas sp. Root1279]|uniref:hypothetical protein n=1 Tax=Brevundimonas sp. Root1279 TaxID=1736443 RepID=UPI0006FDBA5C|nr:hypothetical protein [Brevundimonas sp. Root1279]KQW82894.1 hypothetical protein ASC65_05990 [Brevundimonas sp. Root1279]
MTVASGPVFERIAMFVAALTVPATVAVGLICIWVVAYAQLSGWWPWPSLLMASGIVLSPLFLVALFRHAPRRMPRATLVLAASLGVLAVQYLLSERLAGAPYGS